MRAAPPPTSFPTITTSSPLSGRSCPMSAMALAVFIMPLHHAIAAVRYVPDATCDSLVGPLTHCRFSRGWCGLVSESLFGFRARPCVPCGSARVCARASRVLRRVEALRDSGALCENAIPARGQPHVCIVHAPASQHPPPSQPYSLLSCNTHRASLRNREFLTGSSFSVAGFDGEEDSCNQR